MFAFEVTYMNLVTTNHL